MLKYMLDTNICIYVIKNRPLEALKTFNLHSGQMAISAITLAELIHGCEKSIKIEHNLRQVEDFCSRVDVLNYTDKASQHYGSIRAELEKAGKVIGVNDLHIASHARCEALVLVSNNLKEFNSVSGLRTENWITEE